MMKKEKTMNHCSDVVNPIEAFSCCTPQDSAAHAAQVMRDLGFSCAACG
jgi:hypothetical protein